MAQRYLLDTNAYFNFLKAVEADRSGDAQYTEMIEKIREGNPCISAITKVEIISVLGKYSRGVSGGSEPCKCVISADGQLCTNTKYIQTRKRWKPKKIKDWMKMIEETMNGTSQLISLQVLPFNTDTITEAEKVIEYALTFSFASMDAMIAATARQHIKKGENIIVVTSDKALKCCLNKCGIPVWDAFIKKT